ncbi:hypothetical protein D3C76_1343870 [compost metagenome]
MFCIPTKYPLKTADIATNIIAGESAIRVYLTPGFTKILVAINGAPKNNASAKSTPIPENRYKAVLNILCAPLLSPIAIFSDINFEMVLGIPIVAIASIKVYTVNPEP